MDKGLDLMLDVLHNANFPEDEFERIKKQTESGLLSAKTDPNSMASNAVTKSVFPNHPFGEVMTESSLNNISRQDIIDYYKSRFIPAGTYLVIVGDIKLDKAKELANTHFSSWEGGVPFEASYNTGYFPENNRVIFVEKPGAVQSVINIAFPMDIKPGHEDIIKLSVMNKLFGGGGFGTRLMQNLREDKAWTYGAYSSTNIERDGAWFSAAGSFRNEVTDSAIYEFLQEFENITKDFVTEEELELNKASMAGSFARSLESPRTIANFALSIYRNNLPSDYYQTYLKKLAAVSNEDVLAVAKKYITPKNLNIIVVGNEEVLEKIAIYDGDGVIERLDEFGNPATKKEYKEAAIDKNELINNYFMAITGQKKLKKAEKALVKVTSMEQIMTVKPQGAPIELKMTSYFEAPNKRAMSIEVMGMVAQKEVFDGEKGGSKTMNQTGGHDITQLDLEEVEDKKIMSALLPEIGLMSGKMEYALLGIDVVNDTEYYVLEYTVGASTTKAYYNTETFMKEMSESLEVTEEGPQNITAKYSDFKAVRGIKFPHTVNQMVGSAGLDATVTEINLNVKIDPKKFEL
jgi:predicted Zn-dependent peptidase